MTRHSLVSVSSFAGLACWLALATAPLLGQGLATPDGRVPLPMDWSFKHVIYTANFTAEQAEHMRNDPRLYHSWLVQGHLPRTGAIEAEASAKKKTKKPTQERDWAFSLGTAGVAQNMSPAKYSFNINSAVTSANCTGASADFVVFGLNVAATTAGGQANLVALDNLYSSTTSANSAAICGTSGPSVMFAYAASAHSGGKISTSPVLSFDGKEVMFVESASGASYLNILRWNSSDGGTVSSSKLPSHVTSVVSGGTSFASYASSTCTSGSSCMVSITLGTSSTNTNSSPFYDYANDVMYVGDNGGVLYKITPVLRSSPTTVTVTSVTVASGTTLTAPVLDSVSGNIFVGSSNGILYAVKASTLTAQSPGSIQVGYTSCSSPNNALVDGPLVDSSNGAVFTTVMASNLNSSNTPTAVYEAATKKIGTSTNYPGGTTWTAQWTAQIGIGDSGPCNASQTFQAHLPALDNTYYTNPGGGHLWACGAGGGSANTDASAPGLYAISFNAATATAPPTLNTVTSASPQITTTSNSECSGLTEIYNANTSTDYLFLGEGLSGSGAFGRLFGFTISGTTNNAISGSPVTEPSAMGGTSDIVMDNVYLAGLSAWQAGHVYAVGNQILDTLGDVEQVTAVTLDDKSGSTHPTWPAVGSTVGDNHVTWMNLGPSQTSSVYFGTLATSSSPCGSSNFCAVKLTQYLQ